MRKLFYEYGRLNWLYIIFAAAVIGFLVAFFAALFTDGKSNLFFTIHSLDKWSLIKIWKLVTYAFADAAVWSLVSNLIWLWLFGEIFSNVYGTQKVFQLISIAIIIIGILAGVACFFASEKYPVYLSGFGYALIALASACVYKMPQQRIPIFTILTVPVWVLGSVFLLFRIFTIPSASMAFMIAISLLAIPIGIIYVKYIEGRFSMPSFTTLPHKKEKGKVVAMPVKKSMPVKDNSQEKLDKILEKISAKGLESLTNDEKIFLEKFSQK